MLTAISVNGTTNKQKVWLLKGKNYKKTFGQWLQVLQMTHLLKYIYTHMQMNFNQAEDFISDDSFVSWVYKTDEKHIAQWEMWIAGNPDKKVLAEEAATLLQHLRINESPVSAEQLAAAQARLNNAIDAGGENISARVIGIKRRKIWYAAAAVLFVAVLTISLKFLFSPADKPQLATNYGQIKQDKLPDGTEIILNANSTLTYPKEWKEGTDREVWIKGEAFFHVKKTVQHNKFIVHTDAFDIEVTGTSFDVINRNGKSSIILKEGSVKIHRPGEAEIIMKPGDFVEFTNEQIQKKTITKQDYLAWTESKLVFDNNSLKEVAEIITQHYGIEVRLQGNNLSEKTITGIMPNDNLDVLLQSLEATQEFTIQRTNNAITIANKN